VCTILRAQIHDAHEVTARAAAGTNPPPPLDFSLGLAYLIQKRDSYGSAQIHDGDELLEEKDTCRITRPLHELRFTMLMR
jgi:hypothetical protein